MEDESSQDRSTFLSIIEKNDQCYQVSSILFDDHSQSSHSYYGCTKKSIGPVMNMISSCYERESMVIVNTIF